MSSFPSIVGLLSHDQQKSSLNESSSDRDWCKVSRSCRDESRSSETSDDEDKPSPTAASATRLRRMRPQATGRADSTSSTTPDPNLAQALHQLVDVLEDLREERVMAALERKRHMCSGLSRTIETLRDDGMSTRDAPCELTQCFASAAILDKSLQRMRRTDAASDRLEDQTFTSSSELAARSESSMAADDSEIPADFPDIIVDFLEALGDVSIVTERHAELNEYEASRVHATAYSSSPVDNASHSLYLQRKRDLELQYASTIRNVAFLRADCIAQGLNPDDPTWRQSTSHPARMQNKRQEASTALNHHANAISGCTFVGHERDSNEFICDSVMDIKSTSGCPSPDWVMVHH